MFATDLPYDAEAIGRGAWRSLRSAVTGFEPLEKWVESQNRYGVVPLSIYPPDIETCIAFTLHKEKAALAKKKYGCPATLPATLRSAIVSVCGRLRMGPLPDWEDPLWLGRVAAIEEKKPAVLMEEESQDGGRGEDVG